MITRVGGTRVPAGAVESVNGDCISDCMVERVKGRLPDDGGHGVGRSAAVEVHALLDEFSLVGVVSQEARDKADLELLLFHLEDGT